MKEIVYRIGPLRVAAVVARWAALIILGATLVAPGLSHAQDQPRPPRVPFAEPLFAPRPSLIDYERYYTWVENCAAAVERVRDSVHWGTARGEAGTAFDPTRWREVLTALDPLKPEPAAVGQTAIRCARRFPIATADSVDLRRLERIYYSAPDSVLDALLARWLALLPPDAQPRARAERIARMLRVAYETMRPARLEWADRRLGELDRLGWDVRGLRLMSYLNLMAFARNVGDTIRADRYAGAYLALEDSLPETDPVHRQFQYRRSGVMDYQWERAMARGEAVEPLALHRARDAAKILGKALAPADSAAAVVEAPAIQAAFWFRRADSTTTRPILGKLNLVVFVDAFLGSTDQDATRYKEYAIVRELGERFGSALEITVATHTTGHFRNYPPPTPAEEAEHLRRYFFEHVQLPGSLAVEVAPFTRLPIPDQRRVNQPSGNVTAYTGVRGVLVDRNGQVLLQLDFDLEDRHALLSMIAGQLARSPE